MLNEMHFLYPKTYFPQSLTKLVSLGKQAYIEYVAYLDAGGQITKYSTPFQDNILWTDDLLDMVSSLLQPIRRDIGKGEIIDSINPKKVHAVAAWDDPLPLLFQFTTLSLRALLLILGKLNHRFMSKS